VSGSLHGSRQIMHFSSCADATSPGTLQLTQGATVLMVVPSRWGEGMKKRQTNFPGQLFLARERLEVEMGQGICGQCLCIVPQSALSDVRQRVSVT
jgi:hypothetical protein